MCLGVGIIVPAGTLDYNAPMQRRADRAHETGKRDPADLPVTVLKGVGSRVAERLARLGIHTVQDVLFHLPLRYQDRTRVLPIGGLSPGMEGVVEGEVLLAEIGFGRRRSLLVRIGDGTGSLTLRFFHFSATQHRSMERGRRIRCFGEVRRGPATLEMVHPEYRFVVAEDEADAEETLTPIYPATEGLGQPTLRRIVGAALQRLEGGALVDWLPGPLLAGQKLPPLAAAVRFLHHPPPDTDLAALSEGRHPAQQRLAFEELLAHHLSLRRLRQRAVQHEAPVLRGDGGLEKRLLERLPFRLTGAQRRVVEELKADMERPHPMLRLVQGDVGSGKTVVAALCALHAIEAGYQVALMAPTELLAEQHLKNFRHWFDPMGIPVAWLGGKSKGRARRETLDAIASGRARLVVGTHALFQERVNFDALGLAIIDEQHRFGVHQRLALREKGERDGRYPHQLIMTATPIPRTLAMTAYADLDTSVIDELPPGRTPVTTVAVADSRRDEVLERVRAVCAAGGQAYWVCTLIEESEQLQAQAAEETAARLSETFGELQVGLVHGRLAPKEKEAVMDAFSRGEIDLLVATTVIEVGVDVPNASLMIIENPERLGLAQLHQLRGRVGRGAAQSHCVLLYRAPLTDNARSRLAILRETTDGFEVAQRDLELRGPGEVLGTRQSGLMQLKIADLVRDQGLIPRVQRAATLLLEEHPECIEPLVRRWLSESVRYGEV
ncbi:MAG: ATP-dependent DNA helicase RecG [Gammaproteobacteria bacterium]